MRTGFPSQHPQQRDRVLQRLWLDNLGDLLAVLIDNSNAFVAEEIFDGLAGFVKDTHG